MIIRTKTYVISLSICCQIKTHAIWWNASNSADEDTYTPSEVRKRKNLHLRLTAQTAVIADLMLKQLHLKHAQWVHALGLPTEALMPQQLGVGVPQGPMSTFSGSLRLITATTERRIPITILQPFSYLIASFEFALCMKKYTRTSLIFPKTSSKISHRGGGQTYVSLGHVEIIEGPWYYRSLLAVLYN